MKKLSALIFSMLLAVSVAACSGTQTSSRTEETSAQNTQTEQTTEQETKSAAPPSTVTLTSLDGNGAAIELEVPDDPQRIAILDMAALDMLDNFGLGDGVVGSASTSLDYLQQYVTDETVENLGTIKEADLEAVMACEPDIIFIGGRLSASYDALSEIAPVVYLSTDSEVGVVESVRKNAQTIASIFGGEEQGEQKMAGFDERIQALADFAQGKNAVIGMCTSGSFNVLGNDGRCSIIGKEIGFENLGDTGSTSTHGNESSFERLLEWNPEYIFVLDRDAAIGTDGAQLAQEIMENELTMQTAAYQNGNIVYLEHPAVWYTAEGGITALDYMLSDLEGALLAE